MQKVFLIVSFILSFVLYSSSQNLYDLEHSLKFGEFLFKSGQHKLAAEEFERIIFLSPVNDSLSYYLSLSYRKSSMSNVALTRIEQLYPKVSLMSKIIFEEYIKLLILNKLYSKADSFCLNNMMLEHDQNLLMQLNTSLLSKKWLISKNIYEKIEDKDITTINEYKQIIDEAIKLKYKKPVLSLALSAIIPGSGKIYSSDWKDGLISLITIGASSWQAYRGFNKNGIKSTYGWVFAGLSIGFYGGNLYGSYKSAKKYNDRNENKIISKVQNIIDRTF